MATKDANGALHGEHDGRFVSQSGEGKAHSDLDKAMSALDEVERPRRVANSEVVLSKQEYATLRAEVMRKNAAQKGKVKPVGQAFTRDYFYIYTTKGDDDFTVLEQFDIETQGYLIEEYLQEKVGK